YKIRPPGSRQAVAIHRRIVDGRAADREKERPVSTAEPDGQSRGIAHFERRQRAPGDSVIHIAETHHRRTPVLMDRTGTPAPTKGEMDPGAIVVGRPAPGFIRDPGPAERIYPDPVAIVIGTPVGPGHMRPPDPAVVPVIAPVSIE